MKTAVIDVGGGMRGMYAAGVLDSCLDQNIVFDLAFGISAGSANIASYVAGQKGRNYMFYREYSGRPEYMSWKNYWETGSYIDMDYIYGTLSNSDGENPLDYQALVDSPTEMYTVCTNALTGKPAYFDKHRVQQDQYDVCKASCSIPVVNQPYPVAGVPYFDGALSDPIPMDKAFDLGADKVVIILTKPSEKDRKPYKDAAVAAFMNKYPKASKEMLTRFKKYNDTVHKARELEKQGKVMIVSPDDTCGVDTLERNPARLHELYLKGFKDGFKIRQFLETPITEESTENDAQAEE